MKACLIQLHPDGSAIGYAGDNVPCDLGTIEQGQIVIATLRAAGVLVTVEDLRLARTVEIAGRINDKSRDGS